jgi:hypothetical protein
MSLMYVLQLAAIFQWATRQSSDVENQIVSVERIQEVRPPSLPPSLPSFLPSFFPHCTCPRSSITCSYSDPTPHNRPHPSLPPSPPPSPPPSQYCQLAPEAALISEPGRAPPPTWPDKGAIVVTNLQAAYRPVRRGEKGGREGGGREGWA